MSNLMVRRDFIGRAFRERFGGAPSLWCRSPGRVDLMGSHTDYNLGWVLTLPIDRDTWIAAHPRADRMVRVYSENLQAESHFDLDRISPDPDARWSNYVRGVAEVLQQEGCALNGFDAVIHSTVPMCSGLSSSAALECAVATMFETLGGWQLEPVRKALLCQRAENQFVGVNCGILDQYTSCVGQEGCALLLDCRELTGQPVQLSEQIKVVVCDTKSSRELAASEYGQRRRQCEQGARLLGVPSLRDVSLEQFRQQARALPAEVGRRCRFIIEENARVGQMATALAAGDCGQVGRVTADSFSGACDLYEIASPTMKAMMQAMLASPGIIGARQAGAGFGGCMVAFVEKERVAEFSEAVRQNYSQATQINSEVCPVEAAAGAGILNQEVQA